MARVSPARMMTDVVPSPTYTKFLFSYLFSYMNQNVGNSLI